jgi:hypothetical protein
MKKKILGALALSFSVCILSPASATQIVYMDSDGDTSFPSLSWQNDTTGLAAFTGDAFELNTTQRNEVVASILALVIEDFQPYDIEFVTDTTGLVDYYTWGIDDTAYTYSNNQPAQPNGSYLEIDPYSPCPDLNWDCRRLFGKAENTSGDTDQYGNNIYHEGYARTWAGSFALGTGTASPSDPALNIFTHTVGQIAQALANSAAHEIAHMFGAFHPSSDPGACSMMWVEVESIEANENKCFSSSDHNILLATLGARPVPPTTVPEPGTLTLFGIGLLGIGIARRRKA